MVFMHRAPFPGGDDIEIPDPLAGLHAFVVAVCNSAAPYGVCRVCRRDLLAAGGVL